jgi:hypothetical protein
MNTTAADSQMTAGSVGGSRRRSLLAARAATTLAVLATAAATLGLTAAPALADDCPNAVLRAQNNSTQLPDCRAYEQVSPVYKEGFPPAPAAFTDDGRFLYYTNGNYANNGNANAGIPGNNPYLRTRAGNGWSTKALAPSGPDYFTEKIPNPSPKAFSRDLRSSLWVMRRADEPYNVYDLYGRGPDDVFARIGPLPTDPIHSGGTSIQASDDLSHMAFAGIAGGVYEYVGTGGGQSRPVSVDNTGQPISPGCQSGLGGIASSYRSVSADGRVIFWTPQCDGSAVYARVGGATTIDASASQCTRAPSDPGGACNADLGAVFQGANADGTRVYFTTRQQLVDADTDSTRDLYECDIPSGTPAPDGAVNPCPDLRQVSGATSGADVQGVARISDDGSRAYFVAAGVLASNTDANDAVAVAGDDNLYVWQRDTAHPAGETRFVAKVDPSDAGGVYNSGLWLPGSSPDVKGGLAQATDDGRYLVFASHAALIDHGPMADTDTALDVYRYDAETGALTRLSADVNGEGGNEPEDANIKSISYNGTLPDRPYARVAMSDDGGSVVFTTSEALAPSDTNGTPDTYLWHEGRLSLISSGKPSNDGPFQGFPNALGYNAFDTALISPSGRDVYFMTTAQLVSSDSDTVMDIYDARVNGGFAPTPTPTPCSGDACQGGRSAPPPDATPGSTSSTGQAGSPQTTPAFTVGKLTASQLKRVATTGKVSLSIVTNAPGVLSAQATATIAKRPSTVGSGRLAVAKAGTLTLSLSLSKKARAELRSTRKLTVKVLVRQDNVAIARTVSLKLTQPKPAKKTKKKSSRTTARHAAAKGGRS